MGTACSKMASTTTFKCIAPSFAGLDIGLDLVTA